MSEKKVKLNLICLNIFVCTYNMNERIASCHVIYIFLLCILCNGAKWAFLSIFTVHSERQLKMGIDEPRQSINSPRSTQKCTKNNFPTFVLSQDTIYWPEIGMCLTRTSRSVELSHNFQLLCFKMTFSRAIPYNFPKSAKNVKFSFKIQTIKEINRCFYFFFFSTQKRHKSRTKCAKTILQLNFH